MLCVVFVIALALPAFSQDEIEPYNIGNTDACSNPVVTNASDNVFLCIHAAIRRSVGVSNTSNLCQTSLMESISNYVTIANKSCTSPYPADTNPPRDGKHFFELIRFSIKDGKYGEFIDTDGVECIKAVQENITRCVKRNIGYVEDADNKYSLLWKATALTIDKKSCKKANLIKRCTMAAMRNEGWYKCHYDNDNILYVGSLFDFMLERCTRLMPGWDEVNQKSGFYNNLDLSDLIGGFSWQQHGNMDPSNSDPFQQQPPFNSNPFQSGFNTNSFNSNPFQSGFNRGSFGSNPAKPWLNSVNSNQHRPKWNTGSFPNFPSFS